MTLTRLPGDDPLIAFGAPLQAFDISGISTAQALEGCESFEFEGRIISVLGLTALLANKRAAGREQDLADVAILERLQRMKR